MIARVTVHAWMLGPYNFFDIGEGRVARTRCLLHRAAGLSSRTAASSRVEPANAHYTSTNTITVTINSSQVVVPLQILRRAHQSVQYPEYRIGGNGIITWVTLSTNHFSSRSPDLTCFTQAKLSVDMGAGHLHLILVIGIPSGTSRMCA